MSEEKEGTWDHLWGPELCPTCRQNPFEWGRVDVSFANEQEREREESIGLAREAIGQGGTKMEVGNSQAGKEVKLDAGWGLACRNRGRYGCS